MADNLVLNLGADAAQEPAFVSRATDPVVSNVGTPADFAAQFPTPLDTTEIVAMCEEINLWRFLPEKRTSLKEETYRELNELNFTSGSSYVAFADGACPEEYTHDGDNTTVTLKNIGAKKSLTLSDIMHSTAISAAGWNGINQLVGGWAAGEGVPGGANAGAFLRESVAGVKAKEMILAGALVLNGWDRLLALGDKSSNALEFDGMETLVTSGNGAHADTTGASGTFSASSYDRHLSESCAKPTTIFGHPQAIQEMMSAYFQLGYQGSQLVNHPNGDHIVPGFNFAGEVNTGVGRLQVVADANFTRTASGSGSFQSNLYALRMRHNGEPLVYKITQIPLAFKDLAPHACTAISFQIWAKTALVVKAMCAQSVYVGNFTGRITTTCPRIGI